MNTTTTTTTPPWNPAHHLAKKYLKALQIEEIARDKASTHTIGEWFAIQDGYSYPPTKNDLAFLNAQRATDKAKQKLLSAILVGVNFMNLADTEVKRYSIAITLLSLLHGRLDK
jgi:hypothetical protein